MSSTPKVPERTRCLIYRFSPVFTFPPMLLVVVCGPTCDEMYFRVDGPGRKAAAVSSDIESYTQVIVSVIP